MVWTILIFLISSLVWSQDGQIQTMSHDMVGVLTHPSIPIDKKLASETSKLEEQVANVACVENINGNKCEGYAGKYLPLGKKNLGWKTVLEVKYMETPERQVYNTSRATFIPYNFDSYWTAQGGEKDITSGAELNSHVKAINTNGIYDELDIKAQLLMDQLKRIDQMNITQEEKQTLAFNRLATYSGSMNGPEYLRFISSIAGHVGYNDERAGFLQIEGAAKGKIDALDLLIGNRTGICGDIHSVAGKLGEQKGWESFTTGYVLQGMQHVVTAMVDPKDPTKLHVVNYGVYQTQQMTNTNSVILPVPKDKEKAMAEAGTQIRIFKNKTPGSDGDMQQIGVMRTALGSFMADLAKKSHHIQKAAPDNNNYRVEKIEFEHGKQKIKSKHNGEKIVDKTVSDGVIIYEGETDNAKIFGVALRHDVYKELYKWDEEKQTCVPKKSKNFQLLVASSMVDLTSAKFDDVFYAYLNIKGGQVIPLVRSEHFKFGGVIGYEFDGFYAAEKDGFFSVDANFATFAGVMAEYNKGNTSLKGSVTFESMAGLKDQRIMMDQSQIAKNLNPVAFNAMKVNLGYSQKLNPTTTFSTDGVARIGKIGANFFLSTGIIKKNTSVSLSYQGTFRTLQLGNTLKYTNLYKNTDGPDGLKLTVGQNFSTNSNKFSGSVSGWGGYFPGTNTMGAGLGAKININGKKNRKPATR